MNPLRPVACALLSTPTTALHWRAGGRARAIMAGSGDRRQVVPRPVPCTVQEAFSNDQTSFGSTPSRDPATTSSDSVVSSPPSSRISVSPAEAEIAQYPLPGPSLSPGAAEGSPPLPTVSVTGGSRRRSSLDAVSSVHELKERSVAVLFAAAVFRSRRQDRSVSRARAVSVAGAAEDRPPCLPSPLPRAAEGDPPWRQGRQRRRGSRRRSSSPTVSVTSRRQPSLDAVSGIDGLDKKRRNAVLVAALFRSRRPGLPRLRRQGRLHRRGSERRSSLPAVAATGGSRRRSSLAAVSGVHELEKRSAAVLFRNLRRDRSVSDARAVSVAWGRRRCTREEGADPSSSPAVVSFNADSRTGDQLSSSQPPSSDTDAGISPSPSRTVAEICYECGTLPRAKGSS